MEKPLYVVTVRLENKADSAKLLDLLDEWEIGGGYLNPAGRWTGWVSSVGEPEGGFTVAVREEK